MSDEDYFGALPTGYQLEEYRIEAVLGQGGFGITYKARDTNLNKLVAIKEYLPEQFAFRKRTDRVFPRQGSADDFQWGLERFLQEAQTLGQFEHLNIVPVLRYFEANDTAYMVMAYQDGQALGDILDTVHILEESELEEIIYPLLEGLEAVHRAGVLHRDIKPDNIFIRLVDGTPVLLDFGAARQAIGARHRNVTRIVTPNYAPHEQYHSDGELGPWTDIYALAAVIYEGITGAPPPEAPARITNDKIVPATRAGRDRYRRGFLQAIDAGLAVRHDRRPQTISQWRKKFPPPLNPEIAVAPWRHGRLSSAMRPGSARLAAAAAHSRRISLGESPTARDPQALVTAALADIGTPDGDDPPQTDGSGNTWSERDGGPVPANEPNYVDPVPAVAAGGAGASPVAPGSARAGSASAAHGAADATPGMSTTPRSSAPPPPPLAVLRGGSASAPPAPPAPALRGGGNIETRPTKARAAPGAATPEVAKTNILPASHGRGSMAASGVGRATPEAESAGRVPRGGSDSRRVMDRRAAGLAAAGTGAAGAGSVAMVRAATQQSRRKRRSPLLWVASGAIVVIMGGFAALTVTMMSGTAEITGNAGRTTIDGGAPGSQAADKPEAKPPTKPAPLDDGDGGDGAVTASDGPSDTDPDPNAVIDIDAVVKDLEKQAAIKRRRAAVVQARLRRQRAIAAAKARDLAVSKAFHNRRLQARLPGRNEPTLLRFASNGSLTGATVAVTGFGGDINESGRWWVKDSKLCFRLQQWNGGKQGCFKVTFKGKPGARRVPMVAAGGIGNFSGTLTY